MSKKGSTTTAAATTTTALQTKQREKDDKYSTSKSKWSFDTFREYLSEFHDPGTADSIFTSIHSIIIKTMSSAHSSNASGVRLYVPFKDSCYELYGFDVLLDEALRPWLMEVNISPALRCAPTDVDYELKKELVRDMFNLVGFKLQYSKKPISPNDGDSEAP